VGKDARCENLPVARADSVDRPGEVHRRVAADDALLQALRDGDERVFADLVERWSGAMLRLALVHVPGRAVAEEVVQEAWLVVLRDLDRFERRSSLRSWVLGIVLNLARSRGRAERRSIPVAAVGGEPVVDPARFRPSDAARWPDHWALGPVPWPTPEEALLDGETRDVILAAVAALPPAAREVLVLRDLEGLGSGETCDALGLTGTNQRVLLHRARARVRHAVERYFDATEAC
jgi:RNA polymerase sigma-70 factor (ECF subfamily)